jgi:hypothetical protein
MIFPQGDVAYENLRTAFVDLNSFLQTLKEDNFTGYLQLSFWDYEGILFLEAGEIVNAIVEAQGKRRGGEEAMENIIRMSKQKDGRINVYRLIPEMVTILASTTMNEATYKDLSTEFTSLDKLLDKLSKENHSGFIDIKLNDKKGWGIILFQEGEIVEAVLADEKSAWVSGKNSLDKIIEEVQKTGATFNVYRATLEGGNDRAAMAQSQDVQSVVLEVMQEVVRIIESVVDSLAKRTGTFLENLKKAQIEKSEDYPFLDPFAAEFEYKNGEIIFQGRIPIERFLRGIKDCIELTLDKTPLNITKKELYARIKTSLQPTIEKYKKEIDNIGLKSTMSEWIAF